MASPELEKAINMFRSAKAETQSLTTVDQFRLWYEQFTAQFPLDEDVVCEPVGAGGVSAEWISGPGANDNQVLMYLHGGGYLVGSMRTHRVPLSLLSKASGARVLGLDYRMAPEHPFPAALEGSVAAYRWLLSNGIKPKNIVIGGDSAGGGLAAATLVALRYAGEPMPAAGILHSGWTDLTNSGGTFITKVEEDPIIDREMVDNMAMAYLGDKDEKHPWRLLTTPICADCRPYSSRSAQLRCSLTIPWGLPSEPRRPGLM